MLSSSVGYDYKNSVKVTIYSQQQKNWLFIAFSTISRILSVNLKNKIKSHRTRFKKLVTEKTETKVYFLFWLIFLRIKMFVFLKK